jgi:mycothiol synthase
VTAFSARPYRGGDDINNLIAFATKATAARFPALTTWNPGDIVWQLGMWPASSDFSRTVRIWDGPAGVAALAIFEPPLNFEFDIDPSLGFEPALANEILGWAEERRRELLGAEGEVPKAYAMLGESTVSTTALESDAQKVTFLQMNGYQRVGRHSVRYSRLLSGPLPEAHLPDGMRFKFASEHDLEARAELHREAWSVWGPSSFSANRYRRLRASPLYDELLDVVIEAANGQLVSYCICWFDDANGIGHFEPVGTHPAFTAKGLGRAVVIEGLHRLRERGAHTGLIGTASVNAPALRTYTAAGFEFRERQWFWSKEMP